ALVGILIVGAVSLYAVGDLQLPEIQRAPTLDRELPDPYRATDRDEQEREKQNLNYVLNDEIRAGHIDALWKSYTDFMANAGTKDSIDGWTRLAQVFERNDMLQDARQAYQRALHSAVQLNDSQFSGNLAMFIYDKDVKLRAPALQLEKDLQVLDDILE